MIECNEGIFRQKSSISGILEGAEIPSNYKANKADVDHINELISRADSISSPAEGQAFVLQ